MNYVSFLNVDDVNSVKSGKPHTYVENKDI
jgi:hypothetical protein